VPLNAADGWQPGARHQPAIEAAARRVRDQSIRYLAAGARPTRGYSPSDFQFLHFQIDSEGRTDQRGARSLQSQGIYAIAPASGE
jgi:hypothetical protein